MEILDGSMSLYMEAIRARREIHDKKTSQVWLVVLAGQIVLSTSSNHFLFAKELE